MAAVSVRAARENLARVLARVEAFAARQPAPSRETRVTLAYQRALERAYDDWVAAAWPQLVETEDDSDRDELLATLLAGLLVTLQRLGAEHLPGALDAGLAKVSGSVTTTPMLATLGDALTTNNAYLETSLLPAIEAKLRAALLAGGEDAAAAVRDALASFGSRVGSYAGELWKTIQRITGQAIDERGGGSGGPVAADTKLIAILDPDAHHCTECPQFHSERGTEYASFEAYLEATGDRVPGEFECGAGCRCTLVAAVD